MGRGGAGAGDEDGAGAAVGLEVVDAGLGGVPGGGADAGAGFGGAAQQSAVVGLGEALRGVEQRFVEHGRQPPIAGVRYVSVCVGARRAGAMCAGVAGCVAVGHAGRRASSTRRTGMPSRTG